MSGTISIGNCSLQVYTTYPFDNHQIFKGSLNKKGCGRLSNKETYRKKKQTNHHRRKTERPTKVQQPTHQRNYLYHFQRLHYLFCITMFTDVLVSLYKGLEREQMFKSTFYYNNNKWVLHSCCCTVDHLAQQYNQ